MIDSIKSEIYVELARAIEIMESHLGREFSFCEKAIARSAFGYGLMCRKKLENKFVCSLCKKEYDRNNLARTYEDGEKVCDFCYEKGE